MLNHFKPSSTAFSVRAGRGLQGIWASWPAGGRGGRRHFGPGAECFAQEMPPLTVEGVLARALESKAVYRRVQTVDAMIGRSSEATGHKKEEMEAAGHKKEEAPFWMTLAWNGQSVEGVCKDW